MNVFSWSNGRVCVGCEEILHERGKQKKELFFSDIACVRHRQAPLQHIASTDSPVLDSGQNETGMTVGQIGLALPHAVFKDNGNDFL
jgi:hypothetical protein